MALSASPIAVHPTRPTGLSRTGLRPSARTAFLRDVTLAADYDAVTGSGTLSGTAQLGGLFSLGLLFIVRLEGREPVGIRVTESVVTIELGAGAVTPWSAELPVLTPVVVELVDENQVVVDSVTLRVGFRRIEPRAGALIVNGVPVGITGITPRVNDLTALSPAAWTGTEEWIAARLVHLKQFNVNAIRVPALSIDPLFLAHADRIGLYVIDGTDDESERLAAQFATDPRHPDVAEGTVHPAMFELRHRFSPIEVASTIDELAAGVLRLRNNQFFVGLDGLTVTAHVVTTCGVEHGLVLPVVAQPGETVTVPLPDTLRYELEGETVLALRLVVSTAVDQVWARSGTEIAVLQLTLRENVELEPTVSSGRRVFLDADGFLEHPHLAAGPRLCVSSANTTIELQRRVDSIRWADEEATVTVTAVYRSATGQELVHTERIRRSVDGRLHFDETVVVPEGLAALPRIGIVLETGPGFESVEWIGDGPHESYPGRRRSALHGQWSSTVSGMHVPYVRPRESGGHANVSWADLSDGTTSLSLAFDRGLQFCASHFGVDDLTAASHWSQLVPREQTIVHMDVAHSSDTSASPAAPAADEPLIGAGTYEWSWTLDAR